jgi:cell division protein ZapA (FtsZ GTPase activity inhibitor)
MKLAAAYFSFVVAMNVTVATAAPVEQCRFIDARAEREACYQRQEVARAARQKAEEAAQQAARQKPYEPMAAEDAQLAKSLRSICRGC